MTLTEQRLGRLARLRVSNVDKLTHEGQQPVRLCNYVDVYKNDTITSDLNFMQATATPAQIANFRLRAGDTVFTKDSETADDIGVPAYVAEASADLVCGYHLAMATPDPAIIDPRFLFWAMSSQRVREQWTVLAAGVTRVGLRSDDLGKAMIPTPEIAEQRRIADFLDAEIARIDAAVTTDSRQRDLLLERLDRRLYDEVRGVGRNSTREDAGPPWLGAVRSGWPSFPLRRVARIHGGTSFPHEFQGESAGDLPFVKVADFGSCGSDLHLGDAENWVSRATARRLGAHVVPAGSVLTARVGAALRLNQRRLLTRPAIVDDNVRGLEFHGGDNTYWLNLLTLVALDELANPGPVPSISGSQILDLVVPVPSRGEQSVIGARCQALRAEVSSLTGALDRRRELLVERRRALIAAAVIGQLDATTVRGGLS